MNGGKLRVERDRSNTVRMKSKEGKEEKNIQEGKEKVSGDREGRHNDSNGLNV